MENGDNHEGGEEEKVDPVQRLVFPFGGKVRRSVMAEQMAAAQITECKGEKAGHIVPKGGILIIAVVLQTRNE